jgi:hypothetical protein
MLMAIEATLYIARNGGNQIAQCTTRPHQVFGPGFST